MSINIARFYRQEQWQLDCEIVTPMFLGNANQEAELRAAPFKGLLRYWWRVAEGMNYSTPEQLLKAENSLFGSPDEEHGGKSQVTVGVHGLSSMTPQAGNFSNPGTIDHPECEKSHNKTNPLNYLAGMGLIHFKNGILHSYFEPGEKFQLQIKASAQVAEKIKPALALLGHFAAIGSRSRNGWGCLACHNLPTTDAFPLQAFTSALERDFPHCLGKDSKGPLLWRTKTVSPSWEKCMKELASVYVSLRAGNDANKIKKLEVNSGSPPDRHLLGYPITNHNKTWGPQNRHGSALRLLVRKETDGHWGYILHLPHLFSTDMKPNFTKERQIQIWTQVHQSLDTLCERATMQGGK